MSTSAEVRAKEVGAGEVRAKLFDALQLDLVGPPPENTTYAEEVLTQAPSKWYLTGFLVPHDARADLRTDDAGDDELDRVSDRSQGEDAAVPESAPARKAFFPSSMGLSFLLSSATTELTAVVHWGQYCPEAISPQDSQNSDSAEPAAEPAKKRSKQILWRRKPQQAELMVPLRESREPYSLSLPNSGSMALVVSNRPVRSDRFPPGTRSVSVFLVNYNQALNGDRDSTSAFQAHLTVRCQEGFVPRADPRGQDSNDGDEKIASLQYRYDYEYAVGHNVSTAACVDEEGICREVRTTWIPKFEVPKVEPARISGVQLGMETLANAPDADAVRQMVSPLIDEYRQWIERQRQTPLDACHQDTARSLLNRASLACDRIECGLQALADPDVLTAFQIANRAIATSRRQQVMQETGSPPTEESTWRPFQLAFILLNLVGIVQPEHGDRKIVDLLFFPTGGGKTEAYLGLAAFTLVLRRLKHPDIQSAGVSILMRYTLRLLTLDQLERASRLICALELERQQNSRLGSLPFEIGLWVGQSATPNRMGQKGDKNSEYTARERTLAFKRDSKGKPSPIPLERCPWCGTQFTANSFELKPNEDTPKELRIHCVSRQCDFRSQNPLPILAVDESIYRRLPCFIIATVDKFAGLPWFGRTGALFGRVTHFKDGEGFYSPGDSTTAGRPLEGYLPPPDLIIQDELHLISGPLGTMVGLYETAIDALCCRDRSEDAIRPKVIASTATVRRAERQIKALFGRQDVEIFPPPGPDRHDSFFARTVDVKDTAGRLYVGVAAQGRSLKVVLLKTYLALLAAAQKEWQAAGGARNTNNPADPYMTLLGYFNSLRELGGSRRIVEDEVKSQLEKYGEHLRYGETSSAFANRKIDNEPEELTSRISTNKIANTKRRLALPFHDKERVDIALATNMISVGLDIVRLGLMVVLGQPKTAAEYIQATSRVGRSRQKPGLVVTLMNIHRPRDRSHYERFESWHNSFYRAVEATSVTPFSPRALDRGLAGVTVALTRLGIPGMTSLMGASSIGQFSAEVDAAIETIVRRAEGHDLNLDKEASETLRQAVRARAKDLIDTWKKIVEEVKRLQYYKEPDQKNDLAPSLLLDALDPDAQKQSSDRQKFRTHRSLRDVEPTVNLWVRYPDGRDVNGEAE